MKCRWRFLILAVALLLAACQPETVTTTTASIASPSTTMSVATTATTATGATTVDICGRGVVWEVGSTYVADCFVHPLTYVPEEDGWVSGGATDGYLLIRWTDPDDREFEARVAFIMYAPNDPATDVLDRIIAVDGVEITGAPDSTEVVGWSGLSAELEGAPEQNAPRDPPCTIGDAVWFDVGKFGHGFFAVGQSTVAGIGACQVVQAWVIEVDGLTMTILAGTEDPENHGIAVDAAERLFASMSFGPTP